MTAVMPSSARALASGPASRARPVTSSAASSSARAFAASSSPQTSASPAAFPAASEAAASECSPATTGPRSSSCVRSASDSGSSPGNAAPLRDADLARHAEHRRLADRVGELGRGVERSRRLHREHDEIDAVDRVLRSRRRARLRAPPPSRRLGRDRVTRCSRPVRPPPAVARAPSRRRRFRRAPRPSCDGRSERRLGERRRAAASDISVRVTIGRTSPRPSRSSASASSTTSASIKPG